MKKILSFITLMALTATVLVGCGNNPPKNPEDWTEKDFENAVSQLEEQYEKEKDESQKAETEAPEVEEVVYAPTEEIINADIRSGLIQFNNDVFQQGGYITVADFVEKYSDRYEISYVDGSYEERKDYLLEYFEKDDYHKLERYSLNLTPKYGNAENVFKVYVGNMTSPDEKITLDKAIVLFCNVVDGSNVQKDRTATPVWTPKGLKYNDMGNFVWEMADTVANNNEDYTAKTFVVLLEEWGFEYKEGYAYSYHLIEDQNKYKKTDDVITFYFAGEPNLFGAKPFYACRAYFDTNTDKLKEVNYELDRFLTE